MLTYKFDITNKQDKLMVDAMNKWGASLQINMSIEECSELIHALCKYKRNNEVIEFTNVCEEIADLEIMLSQLRLIFDNDVIDMIKGQKLDRLKKKI